MASTLHRRGTLQLDPAVAHAVTLSLLLVTDAVAKSEPEPAQACKPGSVKEATGQPNKFTIFSTRYATFCA